MPIDTIFHNGENVTGNRLANVFNDFFVNQFLQSRVHKNPSFPASYLSNPHSVFLCPTTEQQVMSTIINMKNSTACDVDDMQIKPVKYVADIIAIPLAHVFNLILSTGSFPKKMQTAKVILIFKGGDKNLPKNYRPISILPVFSKVIEKLIHARLSDFLTKHSLLHGFQHGFHKHCSTETALLKQKEIILQNFSTSNLTLGIYIDFSKAFGSLNRKTLLHKLYAYGVHGVAYTLMSSCLSHRKQCHSG